MCGIATWIYFTILGDKKEQKQDLAQMEASKVLCKQFIPNNTVKDIFATVKIIKGSKIAFPSPDVFQYNCFNSNFQQSLKLWESQVIYATKCQKEEGR